MAALVNGNPDVFSELETLPNNGLSGEQALIYALNTNKGDWYAVLQSEIESARQQFEANMAKTILTFLRKTGHFSKALVSFRKIC